MKITFLGTGTSAGVPMIGCDCPVCRSTDPRNRRRRASLYLRALGLHVIVDTPPDFREEALEHGVRRVDAVLFTHAHADHVFGLDDLRRFNTIQNTVIPAFAARETLADLTRIFDYVGTEPVPGHYRPRVAFHEIAAPLRLDTPEPPGALTVTPLDVKHGPGRTLGFRFDAGGRSLGYVPDCREMPTPSLEALRGVDVMVLDALKHTPHRSHLTVADSLDLLRLIGAGRSYLVHMGHALEHAQTERALPPGVRLSYDGMSLTW